MKPRFVASILVALMLGGCATVLPKPPEQLYRFAFAPEPGSLAAADGSLRPITLALRRVTLPRAAAGDAILTSAGDRVAYVAHARWASPAVVLLQEAVARAFGPGTGVRLLGRGDAAGATAELTLEASDFETRYEPTAHPVVRVAVHATLARVDGAVIADRRFVADQRAAENRIGAIVAAYDRAVTTVLGEVVVWSRLNASAGASGFAPGAPAS